MRNGKNSEASSQAVLRIIGATAGLQHAVDCPFELVAWRRTFVNIGRCQPLVLGRRAMWVGGPGGCPFFHHHLTFFSPWASLPRGSSFF